MTNQDVDGFLMGGARKGISAQFPVIGHSYRGIVEDFEMEQQRSYEDPDELLWWDKEQTKPKMHLVLTLKTNARGKFTKSGQSIDVPGDDGTRNLFVKGAMRDALRKAMRDAGAKSLEHGALIEITYVSDGKQDNPKYNAPKNFKVAYTPAAQVSADEFLSEEGSSVLDDPFA